MKLISYKPILVVALATTLAGAPLGCDGNDADGDAGTDDDRGGCCNEGTDSDVDETVECDESPASCEDIAANEVEQGLGCCHGGTLYWCEESQLDSVDCVADGLTCEYDPDVDAMNCV